jgi:membrane-bound metal-dependent hydrolase YbcI (DUF457 family)
MLAHSHVVIACAGWWAIWERPPSALAGVVPHTKSDLVALAATTAVVAFAALLPDLDHPRGALARYRLGRKGSVLGFVRPLAPVSAVLRWEFGHRGGLHSLLAAGVVYLAGAQFLGPLIGVALAWGYVAHLFADALTREGVPLLAVLAEAPDATRTVRRPHRQIWGAHPGRARRRRRVLVCVGSASITTKTIEHPRTRAVFTLHEEVDEDGESSERTPLRTGPTPRRPVRGVR